MRTLADIRQHAEAVTVYQNDRHPGRFVAYGTVRGKRIEFVLEGEFNDPAANVTGARPSRDFAHLL
jgi:hypothetical protein